MGFLLRWLFAFVLLAATYNPTEYNFVRWAMGNYQQMLSICVLGGLILLVGYIIYVRATLRSIGLFGMLLVLAVAGTMIWVLFDQGLIDLANPTFNTWLAIVICRWFWLSGCLGPSYDASYRGNWMSMTSKSDALYLRGASQNHRYPRTRINR